MRVLLRPVPVPELGLVVLKPGRESMQVFHNPRVLVEPEPKSMRGLPSGVVPAVRQPLAEDKSLLPFFSDERVIRAAGGAGALSDWLLRHVKSCQWPHGDYHHSETVIHRYGTGAMVLCWHCDNQLRDQTSESLGQLAHQNLSAWMIDVIRHAMNGTQERELSLAELSWWAVRNQVADALPEAVLRRSLGLRAEKNPLLVPRKRHRTGRADRHQHTEAAHKKSCAVASHPPATEPSTGKGGGQHYR
ncbi:phage protein [Escherichia coli UMEA 3317-1]|nr:phage protein [Escherichia coli UMEA 3317-1]